MMMLENRLPPGSCNTRTDELEDNEMGMGYGVIPGVGRVYIKLLGLNATFLSLGFRTRANTEKKKKKKRSQKTKQERHVIGQGQ